MIICWNCHKNSLSSAADTSNHPPQQGDSMDENIQFSPNEWEYILHGLNALLDNAYTWGWADTEVEEDIKNIIDRIEKNIGVE